MNDRAGDQMREERNEQNIVEKAILFRLTAPNINQIGDLGKREEGYPEWQNDLRVEKSVPRNLVEIADKEICIFKEAEQHQIRSESDNEENPGESGSMQARAQDPTADDKVRDYRRAQQRDVSNVPPAVEK